MDEEDIDILRWLGEHIGDSITGQLVVTLKKLYLNNRDNLEGFIQGCNAFGKLRGNRNLLKELHIRFGAKSFLSEDTTENVQVRREQKTIKKNSKSILLNYEDITDEEDDVDIIAPLSKPTSSRSATNKNLRERNIPKMKFKKINKELANKLKEYSEPNELILNQKQSANDRDHLAVRDAPKLRKFHLLENIDGQINEHDNNESETNDFSDVSDSEKLLEEREWYNNDDDYGNPVTNDAMATEELDFAPADSKYKRQENVSGKEIDSYGEIQLYAIPINKRKMLIPWFLRDYIESRGIPDDVLIGSFLKSSQDEFINPFKNPDGIFAINARKGSKLVSIRRLARDQTESSRQTAEIAGTSVGNVLGIQEKNPEGQNEDLKYSNSKKDTPSMTEIDISRQKLPAYTVKSTLMQMIRDNQISIIIGETGSGKTTQLAQYIHEAGICGKEQLIGCTQPRRVAAMSVAKRVALEMGVKLGQEVGYSIRFEDETSKKTKIKFMTDGILLRESLLDESLEKYGCIIIDEAHERSLNTDIILGLLKRLLSKRRDLKLIVTSATMNASKFSRFFGSAPLFTIPGRTFPQKLIYSKNPVEDYVESAVMQAVSIHLSTEIESGDILIFMTGQEDIEATSDVIKQRLTEVYSKNTSVSTFNDIGNIEIFCIYSALPADVQNRIFEKLPQGKRKLVIATNIAETSLTIDGIRYVIDPGYAKVKMYNPKIGLDSLIVTPISRANANQRSGRASRTAPGTTYRLYTEDTVEEDMFPQAIPEIQRTNLSNTVLLLKSLGVDDIMQFPFIDAPPLQTLLSSLNELFIMGALDSAGNLTSLGSQMAKFPLQPSLCKILLVSSQNGCSEEILTIVSMLSVPQVFYRPKERMKESDLSRRRFFVAESDHLTLLNVYSQWKSNKFSRKWCSTHFLHFKSLQRAREIREQLARIMFNNQIKLVSSGPDWDIIRKCICSGFAHQSAKRSGLAKYVHLKTGMDLKLHPTSALHGMGDLPPYVIYHELLMTTTEYICCVTSVDPFWLMEYGGLFYDIKRIHYQNETQNIGYMVTEPVEQLEEEDDIDRRIKRCLDERENMILSLSKPSSSKSKTAQREVDMKLKRKAKSAVHIGFRKRRPF